VEKSITEQLALQNKDLQLAKGEFPVEDKRYKSKVISPLEYNKERSKLLSHEIPW
jgi:hypothetical protein